MKKICFVSDFAYPLFNTSSRVTHGGSEMDMYSIATELINFTDFRISFIVGDFGQKDTEQYGAITLYRSFRADMKGIKRLLYGTLIVPTKLFASLRRADADIYFQEGAGFETFLVAIFCRLFNKRFIYRIPTRVECTDEILRLWPIMGRIFRLGIKMADAIVTQDKDEVGLIKKNLGLTSYAIYSTTPIPKINYIIPTTERSHVLWVGRLVKMKHPELFLKIAECFPNENFVLNGPPAPNNSEFDNQIKIQASRLPNVKFYQGMKRADLEKVYSYAKLLINTSDFEGFPITFIEAGKYGVPIITLNVDPDKLFSKNNFGQCTKGNFNLLTDAVGAWLKNIKKRELVGKKFRDYIEKTNDIHKNIHDYISLFNRLLPH